MCAFLHSHLPDEDYVGALRRVGRVEALDPDTGVQSVSGGPSGVPGACHHTLIVELPTLLLQGSIFAKSHLRRKKLKIFSLIFKQNIHPCLVQELPRHATLVTQTVAVGFNFDLQI